VTVTTLAILNVSADAAAIAIAAVAAAGIAARTAQARLHAQLDHDAKMREREATREALDAVVAEINASVPTMTDAAQAFEELFLVRSATLKTRTDQGLADAEAKARRTVQGLRERRPAHLAASFRLHLRFPESDPIIGRLAEWREAFDQLAEDYQAALDSSDFEMAQRFDAVPKTVTRLASRLGEFLTAARAWGQTGRSNADAAAN
jgi:hypothetical protein